MIGAGSVATHLSLALQQSGHQITQVYSRSTESAATLAQKLSCSFTTNLKELKSADFALLAIKDDALFDIASQITLPLAHTSGTKPLEVLGSNKQCGVFYPLQTFSKEVHVDFQNIPVCIEATDEAFLSLLKEIAHSITKKVQLLNSEQRKYLHLSAVMACNFSNLMYQLAAEICREQAIPFELLKPLIEETASKTQTIAPLDAQTGPAKRKDLLTIEQHALLLQSDAEKKKIYELLTESILKRS